MHIDDIDREFQELRTCMQCSDEAIQQGDLLIAVVPAERAYELVQKIYGPQDSETLTCMQTLSDLYYSLRRYDAAVPLLEKLSSSTAFHPERDRVRIAGFLFKLARCYENLRDFPKAEPIYKQILDMIHGCGDRTLAASILESFARFLKNTEGAEAAQEMEARAREVRDYSRSQLTLDLLRQLAADTGEADDSGALDSSNGSGKSVRGLRARVSDADLEVPQKPKLKVAIVIGAVFACAAVCAVVVFLVYSDDAARKEAAAASKAKVQAQAAAPHVPTTIVYKTLDGGKGLWLMENKQAAIADLDGRSQGTFKTDNLMTIVADKKKQLHRYRKVDAGVLDKDGATLYEPNAVEWRIIQTMRGVAATAGSTWQATHSYTSTIPTYTNAVTGKIEAPAMTELTPAPDRSMTMSLGDFDTKQVQIDKLCSWTPVNTGRPGNIELFHFASSAGDILYIRATDREGRYLRGCQLDRVFMVTVGDGFPR